MNKAELLKLSNDHPIIVFDGECNLCNGFIKFLFASDTEYKIRYATLQSEAGGSIMKGEIDSVYLIEKGEIYYYSDAIIKVAKYLPSRKWMTWLGVFPSGLRNFVYKGIAKNRYRLFGKKEACMLPTPEQRKQFLDF